MARPHEKFVTDKYGPLDIPSPNSFYTFIIGREILILSSRRDKIGNTIKTIDLNQMIPQEMDSEG